MCSLQSCLCRHVCAVRVLQDEAAGIVSIKTSTCSNEWPTSTALIDTSVTSLWLMAKMVSRMHLQHTAVLCACGKAARIARYMAYALNSDNLTVAFVSCVRIRVFTVTVHAKCKSPSTAAAVGALAGASYGAAVGAVAAGPPGEQEND